MKSAIFCLLLLALASVFISCASTDPYGESSIPWNAPQPWEGAPSIPGMNQR